MFEKGHLLAGINDDDDNDDQTFAGFVILLTQTTETEKYHRKIGQLLSANRFGRQYWPIHIDRVFSA